MSNFTSNGFSATPVKKSISHEKGSHKPVLVDLDVGVLSEDEDTFSLLSPIYHDSYDSDENTSQPSGQSSPKGCELPQTLVEQTRNPWELWFLNKAKEDRIKLEKKAAEERLIHEKKKQQEQDHEQKVAMTNQRIQEWLEMKRKQEKREQALKRSKDREALMTQTEKQREIELRAQATYKEWLQTKSQEKAEKLKKQKEEAALKEEQEKEQRRRAEDKFKEWLGQANAKNTDKPKSTCTYGTVYPSPSFCNPVPWKPIYTPPETSSKTTD